VTFRGERRTARDRTAARVHAPHAGVVLTGNVQVTGDIAGHTINKNR
jgi:hypothetical protein